MIGVDLFAGAGGLSLGAAHAGIKVKLAVEADVYAAMTYSCNHPDTTVLTCDIRDIKEISLKNNDQATVLFGGPPCQGFSTSNQRTRTLDNPLNWLFMEFLRITKLLKPDWIVFENVTGIKETQDGIFLEQILESLHLYGYTMSCWTLNAANYGVPQRRSRLFAVGSLHGSSVKQPEPVSQRHVTVCEAISDLPVLANGASENCLPYNNSSLFEYSQLMRGKLEKSPNHLVTRNAPYVIERFKYIPQGGNWQQIPHRLMNNYADLSKCHTGIYHRLREDAPSVVIGNYRKNMLIHPNQDRGLSVREAARLQSFPDRYEFKGSIGFQQQQVGNAVPPLLAEAVFRQIML